MNFRRRISQSEIRKTAAAKKETAKERAGKNSFPSTPLPFCPPERSVFVLPPAGRQLVGILFKMSSDFFQQTPPNKNRF